MNLLWWRLISPPRKIYSLAASANCQYSSSSSGGGTTEHGGKAECVSINVHITRAMVLQFAQISGDTNPLHVDPEAARCSALGCQMPAPGATVVHGALLNALVSSVMGTRLPGVGTIVCRQQFSFPAACWSGDSVCVRVCLTAGQTRQCRAGNSVTVAHFTVTVPARGDRTVMKGSATLLLPKQQ